MEIKEGYKQTEIGVIPEDWSFVTLSEVCILSKKKHTPKNSDHNYKCIELEHIEQNSGRLLDYTESKKQLSQKNYFYIGSVLFGKLRPYLRKFYYADFDGVCSTEMWVLLPSINTDSKYLYYLMQSEPVIEACNKSVGTKMPRADWNIVNNTIVAIPPLPEQKAIATALSDIDSLINSLSKLIEKKKNIKQGAMQELLTGKKRLEGFSGEWVEVKVSAFGEIITGSTPLTSNHEYWNGKIPWVTPTDIKDKKNIYKSERSITSKGLSAIRLLKANSILVTCIASIGKNAILKTLGACNQQINAIMPHENYDSDFLFYLFENNKQYLLSKAGITATNIVSKNIFSEMLFIVPPTIEEQTAIAAILSDMDSEIEKLQSKLDKYKAIKLGMMQELLTGKIRLLEGA